MKAKRIFALVTAIALIAVLAAGFAACGNDGSGNSIRFAMPDGTPALAAAKLFSHYGSIAGRQIEYDIVPSVGIPNEMKTGRADIVIMPSNAGANLIRSGQADYKMVSISVLGSLYIVGPAGSGENGAITLDDLKGKVVASIGQNNTPGIVFEYIVNNSAGVSYRLCGSQNESVGEDEIGVFFYDDASYIMTQFADDDKNVDYALLGEPAVTAWKNNPNVNKKIGGELDVQSYWKKVSGQDNFPQAALFVKSPLTEDTAFMDALLSALDGNAAWVEENKADITEYLGRYGSTSKFPPASIARCRVTNMRASDNIEMTDFYLSTLIEGWSAPQGFYYGA